MRSHESQNSQSQKRKTHHLELAEAAQVKMSQQHMDFYYEPMLSGFSVGPKDLPTFSLGEKICKAPLWISSMTGGTGKARHINQNLARVAGEFGLGLGLGSCRPLLESDEYFEDFNLRPLMKDQGILFANLGVAQIEQELQKNKAQEVFALCERLQVDGLFIHVNPLQEWFQPEGDRWQRSPLEIILEFLSYKPQNLRLGVKEVGQGFGPGSLRELMKLPLDVIEFGAFGGTNFSLLESLRHEAKDGAHNEANDNNSHVLTGDSDFCFVGHSATEMVRHVNQNLEQLGVGAMCRRFIVSGGIRSTLQGFYLLENLQAEGAYGMAKPFLEAAQGDYEKLKTFVEEEIQRLCVAKAFLKAKPLPKE